MMLPIKSLTSCLVILATASNILTQLIEEVGSSKKLVELESTRSFVLGSGVEPSQLPIVSYALTKSKLDVSVYIIKSKKQKRCNFTFAARSDASLVIQPIMQLAGSTVVFVWSLQTDKVITTVSIFDMVTCANKNNLKWDLPSTDIVVVVPFVNGFDVITSKNTLDSYDANGKFIDEHSFPINSKSFSMSAVSVGTREKGYFAVDYNSKTLNLLRVDGTLKKPLLKVPEGPVSNNERSLFSICMFDINMKNIVVCYQYDEVGNEKWNNKVSLGFHGVLDVRNLAGGGLVLASLNSEDNKFSIVEMGPKQANTWSYSGKQEFETIRLMNFNKNKRTFVLACIFQSNAQVIELQEYSLASPKVN